MTEVGCGGDPVVVFVGVVAPVHAEARELVAVEDELIAAAAEVGDDVAALGYRCVAEAVVTGATRQGIGAKAARKDVVAFSENGRATLKSLDIWRMNRIWR